MHALVAYSVAPFLYGFKNFNPAIHIASVVFNQTASAAHNDFLLKVCADVAKMQIVHCAFSLSAERQLKSKLYTINLSYKRLKIKRKMTKTFYSWVIFSLIVLCFSACSEEEAMPYTPPAVDDNPGRDIAIPHSVVEMMRVKEIKRYFDLVYDEDGWLQSGKTSFGTIEVKGKLDSVTLKENYGYDFSEVVFSEIKRDTAGYITSMKAHVKTTFLSNDIDCSFVYDKNGRMASANYQGEYQYQDNDSVSLSYCNNTYSFMYSDNTIQEIQSKHNILNKITGESDYYETDYIYSGDLIRNRYCVYDLFSACILSPPFSILFEAGYLGKWVEYVPNEVQKRNRTWDKNGHCHEGCFNNKLGCQSDSTGKLVYSYEHSYVYTMDAAN